MSLRRPVWVVPVFVVGLALHNLVMALLWQAGLRGTGLTVVAAWKEVLLALALAGAVVGARRLPVGRNVADWLALAYGALVILYAILPQSALGGAATHKGVLYGLRHDLVPVAAYFLGRALVPTTRDLRRIAATLLATAAGVAAFGLVDVYAIPLSWWRRHSGAAGWFEHQLGFVYQGLSGLPENFVYNPGNGHPLRRVVSTFLSPLATSYLLVAALVVVAAWAVRRRPRGRAAVLWSALAILVFAGLLWTHSRSSYIALALALVVYAARVRTARWAVVASAVATLALGALFVHEYTRIGPSTTFTPKELAFQEAHAKTAGPAVTGAEDASTRSHWRSLRSGISTVVHHPQGFGLGNAGSTAARTHVSILAGESTYTELGVETGLAGALLFVAWVLVLLRDTVRCWPWVGATLAAMLALGLQTDIIGVPWVAYVVWILAGVSVTNLQQLRAADGGEDAAAVP
ncbi:MAG: O-antigen ligase family protein [Actinobacteria bacterium]|nr:O-antigen ligase family protein [Actinomycetota bacterium]